MRVFARWLSCLLAFTEAAWCGQRATGQAKAVPPAAIEGRITVVLSAKRGRETHPVRNLTVYLLELEESRALQELQRKCRGALAQHVLDAMSAYNTCQKCLAEAVELVPQLSSVATTRTDHEGYYRFDNVPPTRRYQVVTVRTEEEEHIVVVGLTPKLRPGQRVTLDLSENEPWTDAIPGKD